MLTFSQLPYQRPALEAAKDELNALTAELKAAPDYPAARAVFLRREAAVGHLETLSTLSTIRHSIDTRDPFYDGEADFWNAAGPELQACDNAWTAALLASPFRPDFAAEYGEVMFVNAEMALKTFSPAIIPDLQQENALTMRYAKRLASAQIPFQGGVYTLSQLSPFKNSPDDAVRQAAWVAEGQWYKDNQAELDEIYDKLVHLRDGMGKKLGYAGFTALGYYRMGRTSYGQAEVERFRAAVRDYLVPLADKTYRQQAEKLGKPYPMSFADNALVFRSGNPKPQGTPEDILAAGRNFYDALSPETGAFFRMMLEGELLDVLSTEGKEGGGYCTSLPDYGVPFIFANFNGTAHDVEVVTHEAGHAFACWMNRNRLPLTAIWPSMEACEVHSMSMEFLAWPWAEDFFGQDGEKFRVGHLLGALRFIPYGTMVDHFQHLVYAQPNLSPAERHGLWKELLGIYMPWMKLDGVIPFYAEGQGWQRQAHIYENPFYYIDYCLAQTVALQIWAIQQEDRALAWSRYMAYTRQGGSRAFTGLLEEAALRSPFEEAALREVTAAAERWLDAHPTML